MSEDIPKAKAQQDNPLLDIIINVLIPVLVLSKCSSAAGEKPYHLGPYVAMGLALAFPLVYGIWHFLKKGKVNLFSAVGIVNVILTGVISIFLYLSKEPSTRQLAPYLFGFKEAIQPLILGSLFLLTHRKKNPLFNAFIYNDGVFDHGRINKALKEKGTETEHQQLLWNSTKLFFGSFCLSAVLNLGLAYYFLHDIDPGASNWEELYNEDVGRITGWGYLVIGVPLLVIGGFILYRLVKGLKELTGLETEKILQTR